MGGFGSTFGDGEATLSLFEVLSSASSSLISMTASFMSRHFMKRLWSDWAAAHSMTSSGLQFG
jgi:hypothetical protein